MQRKYKVEDLAKKMQGGGTLFDFLVESDNAAITELYYTPFWIVTHYLRLKPFLPNFSSSITRR